MLAPGKRTLHTLLPGMLFRDGERRPWVVAGSMGGDAQPQIHAQVVSALVDGGVDVATAVARAALVRRAGATISRRRSRSASSRATAPGIAEALSRHRPPGDPSVEPFDGGLGHDHAIELVDGGPAAPDGSLAAATDPRSAGLPAVW